MWENQKEVKVNWLFNDLKVNQVRHYHKIVYLNGQLCYLTGTKTITREIRVELLFIVSFNKTEESLEYYKERWQIETMFKSLKSSGFNIEDTHVIDQVMLERLFLLVMVAFGWCYRIGEYIDENLQKIVIKTHGRRAVSIIKYGLDYLSRVLLA